MTAASDATSQPALSGNGEKKATSHPLGPLTAAEITHSSDLIRAQWPEGTKFQFKIVTLLEPLKDELVPYLDAEKAGQSPKPIERKSQIVYYLRNTDKLHEAVVNLTSSKVESNVRLGPFIHAPGDGEEILALEKAMLADPGVQAEIEKLKLPEGTVVVSDPWIYGSDGVHEGLFSDHKRAKQCFLYMRDPANPAEEDSCHYAFPLPISPVIDTVDYKVIRIDILPTGHDSTVKPLEPWKGPVPPNEYIPEVQPNGLRTDLKPLQVVQPEGASFTVSGFGGDGLGKVVRWQKWEFKVGFNQREGMVLYDVHYDARPLFYRLSLSDMAIPYADPRHPFHRKQAFDLGDVGAGVMANNLKLGCDCLGAIYYISGVLADTEGKPVDYPNVICVHEQDAGLLWKHTNYRTGRAVAVRNRELVLQTILTVSNYEYILAWNFNLAGDVTYEVRATGILSTQPVDLDLSTAPHPYGTVVHPGVLGGYHQHFFSLRVDPMVGGRGNQQVVYDEAVALPRDARENPHGVGYTVKRTAVTTSGGYDLDVGSNRTFKIVNTGVRNGVNGMPVGYKLHVPPMQPMLADSDSYHFRRAEFADHPIYVTRRDDRELFAGGYYTNQSRGGTGVRSWADRKDRFVGGGGEAEPVVWVQFGINHIPRVEDFPVMPMEMLKVTMRPVNFFDRNPAMDVPSSKQEVNCSVGLNGVVDGVAELKIGEGGKTCCH